jgi:hypothetical protein
LFPRTTSAQEAAISSPAAGLTVYNTTASELDVYTGSAWEAVGANSSDAAGSTGQVQFNLNSNNDLGASANLFWDNTNSRLGIGTTVPAQKLEVNGSAQVDANIISNGSYIAQADSAAGRWKLGDGVSGDTAIRLNAVSGSIDVVTWGSSATEQPLLLNANGAAVGIGTNAPLSTLSVNGGMAVGTYAGTATASSGNLIVSGSVGIGTTTPGTALQVNGAMQTISAAVNHYYNVLSYYPGSGTQTGTLELIMPKYGSNTMLHIVIKGYDYSGYGAWQVIIGGYNYYDHTWHNTSVQYSGRVPFTQVRLGNNGANDVILLGTTTTTWQYPQIEVAEVIATFGSTTGWGTGWSAALLASESGFANLTTLTPDILAGSGGNIGIGTMTPGSQLHIYGTTGLTLDASANAGNPLNFNAGGGVEARIRGFYDATTQGTLAFDTGYTALTEKMRITNAGLVGIGTTSPGGRLDTGVQNPGPATPFHYLLGAGGSVNWPIGLSGIIDSNYTDQYIVLNGILSGGTRSAPTFTSGNGSGGMYILETGNNGSVKALVFGNLPSGTGVSPTPLVTISSGGAVGIGSTSPTTGAILDVNGTGTAGSSMMLPRDTTTNRPTVGVNAMARYNSTTNMFEFYQNGAWVNFTSVSDARLKTDIQPIAGALEKVIALKPITYKWDVDNPRAVGLGDPSRRHIGFVAQELERVLPEVVSKGADTYRSVEYGPIVAVAVGAIKELKSENDTLRQQVTALQAKVDEGHPGGGAIGGHSEDRLLLFALSGAVGVLFIGFAGLGAVVWRLRRRRPAVARAQNRRRRKND